MTSFFVEKINILEYAFGEGGGGHQKAYAVYAFINVDNCERPLKKVGFFFFGRGFRYDCIYGFPCVPKYWSYF